MRLNLSLGVLAALQLLASLLIQLTVLRIVGVGPLTDAFVAAQSLPLVLFSIISVSLHSVWQPRLSILLNDYDKWSEAQGVAQGQTFILLVFFMVPIGLFSDIWIRFLFSGFDQHQIHSTSSMTLPLLAAAGFNCHSALITTALRAYDKFLLGEVVALVGTLTSLALIHVAVSSYGVEAAAWIIFLRAAGVFIVLYVLAKRPEFLFKQAWRSRDVWASLKPLLAGSSLYKTSPLIDRYWSSQAAQGGVTVLNLAQTAMGAFATVMERAICVPITPRLGRLVEQNDYHGVRKTYRSCVLHITTVTVLAAVVLVAINPVWDFLLTTVLKLPPNLAHEIWFLCFALLGYLHVAASGTIAVSAFYAMDDTHTPVRVGLIGFLFGVFLKSVGFLMFGLIGLAIATSIYYLCNMIAMCFLLEKKIARKLS